MAEEAKVIAFSTAVDPVATTLAAEGLDEAWLEKWLQEKPARLGLGAKVRVVRAQLVRPAGSATSRLDLQAVDDAIEDRVYDIELMRGELDADHGFRTLDYWAREQKNDDQERQHRPVIVAERVRGSRYWTLLEALAEKIDLVALEVRCFRVGESRVVWLEPVLLPEDITPDGKGGTTTPRTALTEADWKAKATADFLSFLSELRKIFDGWGLKHEVDWSAKSYVGLWKGSRCWCPVWPRKDDAGRIYMPAPMGWTGGGADAAPPEFEVKRQDLAKVGIELTWVWRYNGGSNPIALTVAKKDLKTPELRAFLEETWKALA